MGIVPLARPLEIRLHFCLFFGKVFCEYMSHQHQEEMFRTQGQAGALSTILQLQRCRPKYGSAISEGLVLSSTARLVAVKRVGFDRPLKMRARESWKKSIQKSRISFFMVPPILEKEIFCCGSRTGVA